MMGGIDSQVQQRVSQFRSNPEGLTQNYKQNKQLIDLLALQMLKSEKDEKAKEAALQMGQQPTVMQQREGELMQDKMRQVAQGLGMAGDQQMQQQQAAAASGASGGRPPQQQPAGIGSLSPKKFSGGGIVSFAEGGEVEPKDNPKVRELIDKYGYTEAEAIETVYNKGFAKMGKMLASGLNSFGDSVKDSANTRRSITADMIEQDGGQSVADRVRAGIERPNPSPEEAPDGIAGLPGGFPMRDRPPAGVPEDSGMVRDMYSNMMNPPIDLTRPSPQPEPEPQPTGMGGGSSTSAGISSLMQGSMDPETEGALREDKYRANTEDGRTRMAALDKESDRRMQWRDEMYDPKEMAKRQFYAWAAGMGTGAGVDPARSWSNGLRSSLNSQEMMERNRISDQAGIESLMTGNRDKSITMGGEATGAYTGGRDAAMTANAAEIDANVRRQNRIDETKDSQAWRYLEAGIKGLDSLSSAEADAVRYAQEAIEGDVGLQNMQMRLNATPPGPERDDLLDQINAAQNAIISRFDIDGIVERNKDLRMQFESAIKGSAGAGSIRPNMVNNSSWQQANIGQ